MTTSIIVYRNPIEQIFWEALMRGEAVPVFAGLFVAVLILIFALNWLNKKRPRFAYSRQNMWLALTAAAVGGLITAYYLFSQIA